MNGSIIYLIFTIIGIIAATITAKFQNIKKVQNPYKLEMLIIGGIGMIIGAKLPVFILNGFSKETIIMGKSVMGALLGVFIAIHFFKFIFKIKTPQGGGFTIPFAVALGFGKIGCYFNGCCGGDFIIPIQLIESASQFIVAILLYIFYKKTQRSDLLFPIYLLSYLIIRFIAEIIRTNTPFFLGLTLYQWLSVIFLPVVCYIIYKRTKHDYSIQ